SSTNSTRCGERAEGPAGAASFPERHAPNANDNKTKNGTRRADFMQSPLGNGAETFASFRLKKSRRDAAPKPSSAKAARTDARDAPKLHFGYEVARGSGSADVLAVGVRVEQVRRHLAGELHLEHPALGVGIAVHGLGGGVEGGVDLE